MMVASYKQHKELILTLSPNQSASWKQSKIFVLIIASITLTIATGWSLLGYWIILPFAGIEIALVAFLTYKVCVYTHQKQVITVSKNNITIASGVNRPEQTLALSRQTAYIVYNQPESEFDTGQLYLSDNQHQYRIGVFLNANDICKAKSELIKQGLMECRKKWWK